MRFLAVAAALLLAGCTLTPENVTLLAKSCETGQTTYGFIVTAAAAEVVQPTVKAKADQLYGVLKPLCDKGAAATQQDIVLAGFQVYALTKLWRDAT